MIAAMISGRLKEKAKWQIVMPRVTTLTTATMIAPDASNRAQVITMETNDEALGLELRRLGEGDMLTATGEISVQTTGKVHMRVRLVTTITV
ncbi:hypothetical protein [Casimicrobium huifangae]|jgi:hypothetical protein|uniref:hypothetical protein n=1 Tax=Casimicrobium huifangae TaxID=2591109 RepID=UPI0012EB3A7F|nr:hypothetical protein [Casimicrobium huifangae]